MKALKVRDGSPLDVPLMLFAWDKKAGMHVSAKLQVDKIPDMVRSYKGDLKLVPGDVPSFHYIDRRNKNQDSLEMMGKAEEILKSMCGIRI